MFGGNHAMEQGNFERQETEEILALLPSVDLVVNVGANIGYYCCLALHAGKDVVAVEPMPANLEILYRNLSANGWDRKAEVLPVALSDTLGIMSMYGGGTGASLVPGWANVSRSFQRSVPVNTADNLLSHRTAGRRCLFIVDIEGAELPFLHGAAKVLAQSPRPVWFIEINSSLHWPNHTNPNFDATFSKFFDAGYVARLAGSDSDLTKEQIRQMSSAGTRAHNFIFR